MSFYAMADIKESLIRSQQVRLEELEAENAKLKKSTEELDRQIDVAAGRLVDLQEENARLAKKIQSTFNDATYVERLISAFSFLQSGANEDRIRDAFAVYDRYFSDLPKHIFERGRAALEEVVRSAKLLRKEEKEANDLRDLVNSERAKHKAAEEQHKGHVARLENSFTHVHRQATEMLFALEDARKRLIRAKRKGPWQNQF